MNLLGPAGQNRIRHHARNLLRGMADMWLDTGVVSISEQRDHAQLICARMGYQYFLLFIALEAWSVRM